MHSWMHSEESEKRYEAGNVWCQSRFERPTFPLGGAKFSGVYKGPPEKGLHQRVGELLGAGQGIRATARHTGFSTTTALKSAMK
ncbi:hypothetical protein EMIT0P228_200004 [Pseudomonas brassicacearum]